MLSIQLLGQFTLSLDGKRLELPSRPAQSLLAWLVLYPNIAHRREQIAGLLWPDATEENARNNLRHALWRLRRAIPQTFIQSDRIAIRWLAGTEWRLDVTALVDTPADATSADALLPGLAAYAGELLPGFYDDWIIRERERLSALFAERMARALELLQSERRWHETIDWTERWIARGETPELAYRVLMIAHASLGNSSAALATYQRCTEALDRELGVPPSPETTALADSIRTAQFDLLHSPQSASAPPTLSPVVRTNLPAATTPLIGRDAELAHLSGLLTDSAHRLMTILGPGGMGKSRLALAAGHASLDHFPDGVFLVELVALSSAREIPRAISDALGYAPQNDTRPLRQQILDALRGRTLLLLLDNFEHLLEGSAFLVEMLEAAPGLHLLVTSRERLRLHAETLFRLNGLVYPSSGQTAQTGREFGAVELFVRSAQRTQQDFAPGVGQWPAIAHICRMVDGLPLGIVLAAGWSGSLSITEIAAEMAADADFLAQEMGDLDPRHRAITRVFEQSWQRLSAQEQQALAGMCLFAGGFDRESARAVAGATLSVLSRLVDKSLLWRVGEGRYDLHELVRQLARQKLISSGEEAARRTSHCRWFLAQVAWQEARLKGSEQDKAIAQMESEWENIRAAWLWAVKTGEGELLQRAIEPLGIFCSLTGHWEEGEGLMAGALSGLGEPATPQAHLLYGWFLAWHGVFFHTTGKPALAQTRMAQALALVEDSPQPSREIRLLRAFVYLHRGGDLMTNRQRAAKIDDMLQARLCTFTG
ncbi:MAG: BTAD domain-containing putative transcriptional regulator [Caldilineaceae bacterium]